MEFFLNIFNFFRKLDLWSTRNSDAFLAFDRDVLFYSISEPATNRNPEEQLLWELPEKKCVGKVSS